MPNYSHLVLRGPMRKYVIEHKGIFEKAIIAYAKILSEPTRESCFQPNSHRLFNVEDKFFKHENNNGKKALFEAIFKLLIVEYEHDPYYRERINWVIREIINSDWEHVEYPISCWKE